MSSGGSKSKLLRNSTPCCGRGRSLKNKRPVDAASTTSLRKRQLAVSGDPYNPQQKGPRSEHAALIALDKLFSLLTRYDLPESARPVGHSPRGKNKSERVSCGLVRAPTYIAWHDPHTIAG